jgi:V8-like Glu-specific endopeptidase
MGLTSAQLELRDWNQSKAFKPLNYRKIVGLNNLLNIAWLSRGLQLAAAVARIVTLGGPGTAFLIGPNLLLTNHHVIPDSAVADKAVAEFNYQLNWAGTLEPVSRVTLDSGFFKTNPQLDYTIVRVRESPGNLFGYIDLTTRAVPAVNDYVSIIQHPQGGPKQVCFTDNKVAAVFGDVLQYSTDTEPGSSGSPVFNQNWQIVGLHHKGGGLAGPDGEKYFTNEGILITSILRDAASFLGLPDMLFDLAFGDLRAVLVHLVDETVPPSDPRVVADDFLRTRPRFSYAVDDWAKLNCASGDNVSEGVCAAGIAIGAALRQWARNAGHESIRSAAMSKPEPSAKLYALVGQFNGSGALPSDVYAKVLAVTRAGGLTTSIVKDLGDDIASMAYAFLTGVSVGAKAYDGAPPRRGRRRAATR